MLDTKRSGHLARKLKTDPSAYALASRNKMTRKNDMFPLGFGNVAKADPKASIPYEASRPQAPRPTLHLSQCDNLPRVPTLKPQDFTLTWVKTTLRINFPVFYVDHCSLIHLSHRCRIVAKAGPQSVKMRFTDAGEGMPLSAACSGMVPAEAQKRSVTIRLLNIHFPRSIDRMSVLATPGWAIMRLSSVINVSSILGCAALKF